MQPKRRRLSLLALSSLWIIAPFALLMAAVLLVGVVTYQQTITKMLLDRDRQLATLSATSVSQALDEYALILQAFAEHYSTDAGTDGQPSLAEILPAELLDIFNAGIVLVDKQGTIVDSMPPDAAPIAPSVGEEDFFQDVRRSMNPQFSDVRTDARTGQDMVLVSVPLNEEGQSFGGLLAGGIHLHTALLGEPVRRLLVGDEGFAYLTDSKGRVVFHPDGDAIGSDFSDRPFMNRVTGGETGGLVWTSPEGVKLVLGFAPVGNTGWGLVVREPWEILIQPARVFAGVFGAVALAALGTMAFLLWHATSRITMPIQLLATQIRSLAAGEFAGPVAGSRIREIDELAQTFGRMARQMTSYRAGLRRYVGAVTRSQEDERRRIARELHDETIQSLLAIDRRLELSQTTGDEAPGQASVVQLRAMVKKTLQEVRQITRDLRPLVLEDLGLESALRSLVETVNSDPGSGLRARLHIQGSPVPLERDHEFALYRIAQEAVANVRRHAQASRLDVVLGYDPSAVRLEVQDDGIGFEPPSSLAELAHNNSYGLLGIQERAWSLSGVLEIETLPERGTRLRIRMPLPADADQTATAAPAP